MGSYESRGVLIKYRGAMGVISPDGGKDGAGLATPMKEDDKTELQNDFLRYGLLMNQWKFIISSAAVKWSQIGIPTKELMLFEEIEDDIMRLCDGYNFPYPLMASAKTNNLGGSNTDPNKTLLYQDAIIPEAESICEQWNSFFDTDTYDLVIQKDFSHVPALQQDEQKKAQARLTRNNAMLVEFNNNICTLNDWRVANAEDPITEGPMAEFGTKYYFELIALGWKFGSSGASISVNSQDQNQQSGNSNNSSTQNNNA
jgi:hypothetical protein